ncbi:aminoacyl-tRNA hydrolase [Eubacterium oxidoreducens]|uniref:Peptidyl-tRNA hydrolase n=1 Tax=Eubacterium oxidoreducens TaxID=1732 RepID=A0A1G6BWC4_EUBOX|nr:aminoacyl-tRNA hydrolase [Eubacterium oxidoreducens]SDB24827.1 peptidyl-tRNA hydrolase, PTH1 family [Eubacterium oxidoreducens]
MYLIAGLGNPTTKYEKTRHNVGFDAIDELAKTHNIDFDQKKHHAMCGKGMIAGQKVMLMKPLTYMNNSGEAIADAMNFYKLDPATQLLVIYDDISLEPGNIRIRKKGSAGGHNGIKDIIAMIGSQQFARIKIGVGEKPKNWDLADYVLGKFDKADRKLVDAAIEEALQAAQLIVGDDIEEAMNQFNAKKK